MRSSPIFAIIVLFATIQFLYKSTHCAVVSAQNIAIPLPRAVNLPTKMYISTQWRHMNPKLHRFVQRRIVTREEFISQHSHSIEKLFMLNLTCYRFHEVGTGFDHGPDQVQWYHQSIDMSPELVRNSSRILITYHETRIFVTSSVLFRHVEAARDVGIFQCRFLRGPLIVAEAEVKVISPPIIVRDEVLHKSSVVLREGSNFLTQCSAVASQEYACDWRVYELMTAEEVWRSSGDSDVTENSRLLLGPVRYAENGCLLEFRHVSRKLQGSLLVCRAFNDLGEDFLVTTVYVKSALAEVYPSVGIITLVGILVIFILCEKRKKRKRDEKVKRWLELDPETTIDRKGFPKEIVHRQVYV